MVGVLPRAGHGGHLVEDQEADRAHRGLSQIPLEHVVLVLKQANRLGLGLLDMSGIRVLLHQQVRPMALQARPSHLSPVRQVLEGSPDVLPRGNGSSRGSRRSPRPPTFRRHDRVIALQWASLPATIVLVVRSRRCGERWAGLAALVAAQRRLLVAQVGLLVAVAEAWRLRVVVLATAVRRLLLVLVVVVSAAFFLLLLRA